jgi:hypothetical protein
MPIFGKFGFDIDADISCVRTPIAVLARYLTEKGAGRASNVENDRTVLDKIFGQRNAVPQQINVASDTPSDVLIESLSKTGKREAKLRAGRVHCGTFWT